MKDNNLLKFFLTRKINWVIIGYLFLGIFFVAAECGATNFWTIFLYVMSSYKFCLAFLYPTFILIFINFYQLLDSRDDIILRLKERTKYFKYYLKNSLMIIAYYMLVLLLLMGIAINLRGVSSYNLVLYRDYTNNFLPIPLIILKTFFTLLEFNLIEFSLSAKFNNQKISVIISLILEILIASSIDFYNYESILRFINPGFYAFSLGFCTNAYLELLMCGIYHLIIISILVLLSLKIIKNCNINIGFRK